MVVRILQLLGDTLRLRDESYREIASRTIDLDGLDQLLQATEKDYKEIRRAQAANDAKLLEHGKRLFQWLDGTEQWLSGLRTDVGLALHIDVESRLRNLPWELLFDTAFLCANPVHFFTPVYRVGLQAQTSVPEPAPKSAAAPQNRPLRVLFMAASAEGVEPELSFEEEERMILEATRKQPIELVVEESGCLEWLAQRIADNSPGYFDVAHLTGHAHQTADGPRFILENEVGGAYVADARQIADAFQSRCPRLLFLSSCEITKAGVAGASPSLAEELVNEGFPAVFGWAFPVGDVHASKTASVLYERLAVGDSLVRAVAFARQKLLEEGSPYWHLLRLYADDTPLTPLVTPRNTPGRDRLKSRPARSEFLDAGSKTEVCPREKFVGRRRLIKRCLRILGAADGQEEYADGVLLTGLAGLGKSSLAAHLADLMPSFQRVVIVGALDEPTFRKELRRQLRDKALREVLELEETLEQWLSDILDAAEKPILFIFDDFEKNQQGDASDDFRPTPNASRILHVLAAAIRETASPSRMLVTCRYRFELPRPFSLGEVPLLSMRDVELEKKLRLLQEIYPKRREDLESRAIEAAAGNPRLLDRLYPVLADDKIDLDGILDQMEKVEAEFREDIFLEKLVETQTPTVRRLLAIALLVGIPFYAEELEEILPELRNEELEQATATGLLEHFTLAKESRWYYASPLLGAYLGGFLNDDEVASTSGLAARILYETRREGDGPLNDEIALIIRGLALAGGEIDIAAQIVQWLCGGWLSRSAYRAVKELCEDTLKHLEDYRVLHQLARGEEVLGDTSRAEQHYRRAIEILPPAHSDSPKRELRDRSSLLHNLAGLRLSLGNPAEAMELWQESLEINDQIGDIEGKADTLHNMARLFEQQGQVERAMELWQESLEIYDRIGDVRGKADTLHNMARLFEQQGQVERAMELWHQSLEINDQIGDVKGKAATRHEMASVFADQGNVERAMELWHQSLEINDQIGDVKGKADTLHEMAGVFAQQGNIERAMELWQESLEIYDRIGIVKGKAATLHEMALVLAQRGDIERAMELWQQSLEIEDRIGNVQGKAATLANMAAVFSDHGAIERAMDLWQESLEIRDQIGDVKGKAVTLNNIAGVFAQQGAIERAMDLWQESLEIRDQIGDIQGKATTLANMGWAARRQGQPDRAMDLNREAATILVGIRAWPDLVTVLGNMEGYFALQALWLGLRVLIPAVDLLELGQSVFMEWTPESAAAPLLASSLHYLVVRRYQDHPKHEELSKSAVSLLAACAEARQITPEGLQQWVESERLNDPDFFMPALDKALRERIPDDSWLFDPALFDEGKADQ